mmetsp:Transcript_1163/g.2805  ORF Transcript_1163/g.2805 Transcript_1163/m.2805 type:complete len:258 (+) Transcript_1163:147-920(+)
MLVAKFGQRPLDLKRCEEASTNEITHYRASRKDDQVTFLSDFVDTPGYGHFSKHKTWVKMIKNYISLQALNVREQKESGVQEIDDSRVHLCLYFIRGPFVHPFDIDAMKILSEWVSVLPVLAKADLYTSIELAMLKRELTQRALACGLTWFDCNSCGGDQLQNFRLPFAVSSFLKSKASELLFSRRFPWGLEDEEDRSDFDLLVRMLLTHFVIPAVHSGKLRARQWVEKRKKKPSQLDGKFKALIAVTIRLSQYIFS